MTVKNKKRKKPTNKCEIVKETRQITAGAEVCAMQGRMRKLFVETLGKER